MQIVAGVVSGRLNVQTVLPRRLAVSCCTLYVSFGLIVMRQLLVLRDLKIFEQRLTLLNRNVE